MKIALATESITPPLSGIGRYTWELASRLPVEDNVAAVRYLAHGRWQSKGEIASTLRARQETTVSLKRSFLRKVISTPFTRAAYRYYRSRLTTSNLNRSHVDIFHGPNYFCPAIRIPSAVTIHDLSTLIHPQWHPAIRVKLTNQMIAAAMRNASVVITDAHSVQQELAERFPQSEKKICVVPLGTNETFVPWRDNYTDTLAQYGLTQGRYSLFVSTIEPRKNISRLLQAYARLPKTLRNEYTLVLAGGPGWHDQQIFQQINSAVREGWLKYLGFVPEMDLPALYAGAHAFLYPSLYEGFGLPIAEAMACGVPVLTSNCSSMPEVAGGAAFLVDPQDEESIFHGLSNVLDNDIVRAEQKTAGLLRAAELTWAQCAKKTVAAYQLAIDSH